MIGGAPFWRDGDQRQSPLPALRPVADRPVWVSPSRVIAFVCQFYRIEESDFFAHRRADELVSARALVVWLLRTVPAQPMSYPQIGRAIERDHTSAMHLHKTVIRLRLQDRAFKRVAAAMQFHFTHNLSQQGGQDHASV